MDGNARGIYSSDPILPKPRKPKDCPEVVPAYGVRLVDREQSDNNCEVEVLLLYPTESLNTHHHRHHHHRHLPCALQTLARTQARKRRKLTYKYCDYSNYAHMARQEKASRKKLKI